MRRSVIFPLRRTAHQITEENIRIYLVTGEVQCVGKVVAEYFSVHVSVSTEMDVVDGVYSGTIRTSLAKKEGKRDAIQHIIKAHPYKGSLAFGDSGGDIEMFNAVANAF